jgi:hypothetical protein
MEGLLSTFLKGTVLEGVGVRPQLLQNDIVIELTEQQIRDMVFKDMDDRVKNSISLEVEKGKIIIKVKLF